MKIVKIASVAISVLLAWTMVSCNKEAGPVEKTIRETRTRFSVELSRADADYAEVVVRHYNEKKDKTGEWQIVDEGNQSDTWYGFITKDLETPVADLVKEQMAFVDAKTIHTGKSQTVALRYLDEHVNYRYIAFGVNEEGEAYGDPGALAFCTSPVFDVTFAAEATDIQSHQASFSISHGGLDVLTYKAFITEDTKTAVATLAAADYAEQVDDHGKIKSDVELLSGNSITFTAEELEHEKSYRLIVYGIYDNNGVAVFYGTPAEVLFSTPIDLSLVTFNAVASGITKNSVNIAVSYTARQEDLTWYGFYTEDVTSPAASLIAQKVATLTEDDLESGAKSVALTGLTPETDYRYIVTGVNASGAYGNPAVIKFSTLTEAYDNCVFTVEATEVKALSVTLKVTHTGLDDFQYAGFFTDDMTSAVADIALPANVDSKLMTGKEYTFTIDELSPVTKYRYIVVGRYSGNEYGTRGEVVFTTADNAISLPYDAFIGEWKINGQVFSVTQKVAGVSYNIDGLPSASSARCGISTVEGLYDSDKGQLYVMDQDLAEYDDPSTNNYGRLKDFYAGAKWTKMSNGSERYWAIYPFRSDTKSRAMNFIGLEDGTFVLRAGSEGVEAVLCGWVILQGTYAGSGNCYSGEIVFPATVEKFVKKAATYEDFLGKWKFATSTITISQKVAGSTYSVTGLFDVEELYGDVHEVVANYDAEKHEFYLMEQKLGAFNTADVESFGSNQYGDCDDYLIGIFSYSGSTYPAYPYNTDEPACLFTAFINGNDVVEIIPGSCSYGPFVGLDYWWIIREGEDAGKGNSYHADSSGSYTYETLPETMTKVSGGSSVSSVFKPAARPVVAAGSRVSTAAPSSTAVYSVK